MSLSPVKQSNESITIGSLMENQPTITRGRLFKKLDILGIPEDLGPQAEGDMRLIGHLLGGVLIVAGIIMVIMMTIMMASIGMSVLISHAAFLAPVLYGIPGGAFVIGVIIVAVSEIIRRRYLNQPLNAEDVKTILDDIRTAITDKQAQIQHRTSYITQAKVRKQQIKQQKKEQLTQQQQNAIDQLNQENKQLGELLSQIQ